MGLATGELASRLDHVEGDIEKIKAEPPQLRLDHVEGDIEKIKAELGWLRRGMILLALSTAGAVVNLKAETLGELIAAVLKAALKL